LPQGLPDDRFFTYLANDVDDVLLPSGGWDSRLDRPAVDRLFAALSEAPAMLRLMGLA
jgi:hypothetical protein